MDTQIIEKLCQLSQEEKDILLEQKNIQKDIYSRSEEFIINSEKLLTEGKNIDLRLHTRFIDFPEHKHDYVEFMYVYAGSITHQIDGESIVVQSGDILFLNRHIRHSIRKAKKEDIGINFIVSNAFLQYIFHNVQDNPVMYDFLTENFNPNGQSDYLFFKTNHCFPIRNLMDNLIYALVQHTPHDHNILSQLISLLFSYLAFYPDTLVNKPHNASPLLQFRQSVTTYIQQNYPSATLQELAMQIGYTPVYLPRKIRRIFGTTFQCLLQNQRLRVAEKLLSTTNLHVDEIIRTVGYENQSFFHLLYKSRYGMTPFQYKLAQKGNYADKIW